MIYNYSKMIKVLYEQYLNFQYIALRKLLNAPSYVYNHT